jgi:methionine synthase I (cobalamin-dependent)
VRQALAAQIEAGADVVVAPAWLTHRRALIEIGESRRATEWTRAAVQLAREAVEEGLPRRGEPRSGEAVLVAGPLPDLDARPEAGSGHLAERGAAADRDRDAQAGILAEAGVDLILVEKHLALEASARSVAAASATGLDVWATIQDAGPAGGTADADAEAEAVAMAGATTILLEVPGLATDAGAPADAFDAAVEGLVRRERRSIGVLLPVGLPSAPIERFRRWLEAGASVLGVSEGAAPDALRPLREAIDAGLEVQRAAREASEAPWRAWVAEAAERAPSGAALWLEGREDRFSESDTNQSGALPTGFAWTRADASELRRLPTGAYRFVVADGDVDVRDVTRLLDEGGIAVARPATHEVPRLEDAQVVDVRRDGARTMIAVRRAN